MEINDVLGLGKVAPINKLLKIFEKATGKIYRPIEGRIENNLEAHRIKKLITASTDGYKYAIENTPDLESLEVKDGKPFLKFVKQINVDTPMSLPEATLLDRAKSRIDYQQEKAQENIENIVNIAANNLIHEEFVGNNPVDDNWITRFFKYSEEISSQQMQLIWGHILSSEVRNPNTFSLRTLDVVRNLTKIEADLFTIISKYVIVDKGSNTGFIDKSLTDTGTSYYFKYDDLALLQDAGLISENSTTEFYFKPTKDSPNETFLFCNRMVIKINFSANSKDVMLDIWSLTQAGLEVLSLVQATPDLEYLKMISLQLKEGNIKLSYDDVYEFTSDETFTTINCWKEFN